MRRNAVTWSSSGKQPTELYVDEPVPGYIGTISYDDYDVFISHKGEDTELAELAGDTLQSMGVYGYLDRWDPAVDGDSAELEIHIRSVIRATPSILAVVTENTPLSWWVPFEIGVARETKSQIATFLLVDMTSGNEVPLPSYLRTWPILVSASELKIWARLSQSHDENHRHTGPHTSRKQCTTSTPTLEE